MKINEENYIRELKRIMSRLSPILLSGMEGNCEVGCEKASLCFAAVSGGMYE